MIEDGDKIDPARTELSRQKSLDKALERRVIVTDIVEELKDACNGHPDAVIPWPHRVLHEAADEIERLRDRIAELDDEVYKLRVAIHHANKEARLLHIVSGRMRDITHQALREGLKDD